MKIADNFDSCYSHIRPKHWYWNHALVQSVAEIINTNLQLGVWYSFSVWWRTSSHRKLKAEPIYFKIWFCRRLSFSCHILLFLENKGGWIDFSFLSWSFANIIHYFASLLQPSSCISHILTKASIQDHALAKSVADIWNMKLQ